MRLSSYEITFAQQRWTCPCCRRTFTTRDAVVGHLVDEGLKQGNCTLCSKPLAKDTKRNNFKQHVNRHVDEGQACGVDGCEAVFTSGTALRRHRETAHRDEVKEQEAHPCPLDSCEVVCSSDGALRKHLKVHQNLPTKCNHCDMEVRFKDLKRHKAKECEKLPEKVAICPWEGCEEEIPTNHISRHIRKVHTNVNDVVEMAQQSDQELLREYSRLLQKM